MRGLARVAPSLATAFGALLACAGGALAQGGPPERVAVTIDYVSVEGMYLAVGADQGVVRGDTVAVYVDATAGEPLGRLVFTSVTRRRSVARAVDASLRLGRGAVVYLPLSTPLPTSSPVPATAPAVARAPVPAPASAQPPESGPRVSGRLAMDVDLRETHTSWTGDLSGDTRRRFATPTTRLALGVDDLPGGVNARLDLRASYRYDELTFGPPPTSVRVYEASVTKAFDVVPMQLTAGRFSDPYERYSAYWDGLLVRLGRRIGPGVGAVAGFEPRLYDQGFSTSLPKVTGFVDYSGRGRSWRYDTDVSVHFIRPSATERLSYVGWSQALSVGPLSFNQRLRLDGGLDGSAWSLGELRLRGRLDVAGPVTLRGTFGRSRWSGYALSRLLDTTIFEPPEREELLIGADVHGRQGRLSLDAGRTRRQGSEDGLSVNGGGALRLGVAELLVSGQRWWRGGSRSLGVAPGLGVGIGRMRWRLGYRYYRTRSPYSSLTSHAAQAQVDAQISSSLHLILRGDRQWGKNLTGVGLHVGLWQSF